MTCWVELERRTAAPKASWLAARPVRRKNETIFVKWEEKNLNNTELERVRNQSEGDCWMKSVYTGWQLSFIYSL